LAAAKLQQDQQSSMLAGLMKVMGMGGDTVELTSGYDDEGKPVNTKQAAYQQDQLLALLRAIGLSNPEQFMPAASPQQANPFLQARAAVGSL